MPLKFTGRPDPVVVVTPKTHPEGLIFNQKH